MSALIKKISKKLGLKPGSVVYVGVDRTEPVEIHVIDYDSENISEHHDLTIEDCVKFKDSPTVTWIDFSGVHNVDLLYEIGDAFGISHLVLEDIANTGQHPKVEFADGYFYITLKMIYNSKDSDDPIREQVSIIVGDQYIVSFQERSGDVFDTVRERIRRTKPRKRFLDPDYLAYTLVDAIVDHYYPVLEHMGDKIEELEDDLIVKPQPEDLQIIQDLKRHLTFMRRAIWPLRELVSGWERAESPQKHDETAPYLRDLYEHTIQAIDTVEAFRDMVAGLLEIYLSSVSNRMNEVMKVLTIIATIFIPLSFLAGVYGMNFDTGHSMNMPELGLPYGYILFWVISLVVGIGLFVFFKLRKWI